MDDPYAEGMGAAGKKAGWMYKDDEKKKVPLPRPRPKKKMVPLDTEGMAKLSGSVAKKANGGSVRPANSSEGGREARKEGNIARHLVDMQKRDKNGGVGIVLVRDKSGKLDTDATANIIGRNRAEGFMQKMDRTYGNEDAGSIKGKAAKKSTALASGGMIDRAAIRGKTKGKIC